MMNLSSRPYVIRPFSRVHGLNESNVTRVCWCGNDVNTRFHYLRRTIEETVGEAPLLSGRNVDCLGI